MYSILPTTAVNVQPGDKLLMIELPFGVKFDSAPAPIVWQVETFKGAPGNNRAIIYLEANVSIHLDKSHRVVVKRCIHKADKRKLLDQAFRSVPCGVARTREEFMKDCRR